MSRPSSPRSVKITNALLAINSDIGIYSYSRFRDS